MASRFTVITGDPGAGKSTLLKYIAVALAEKKEKQRLAMEKPMLPILFPVSAFADALRKPVPSGFSIEKFLKGYFKEKSLPGLIPLFRDAGRKGRALYLIDGLDEVSDESERQDMVQRIRDFIINNMHDGNRYIVTCRTASYTRASRFEAVDNTEFSNFKVMPFNMGQIEQFLLNWYRYYHKVVYERAETFELEARSSLEKMITVIDKDRNIRSIATNPLMLTILALVEHEGGKLPENRVELYQKCLILLAGTWESIRSIHITKNREFKLGDRKITEDFIVHHLGLIAKRMHENAEAEIDYDDLKRHLAESFDTRNRDMLLSREQADEFIQILKQQSGIIQEATPNVYNFSHQTFKEYLAARFLTDICEDPVKELGNRMFTPEWKEVVQLIAATFKKRDATNFINSIMEAKTPKFENITIAGECVADIGRDRIFDDCYDILIQRLEKSAFGYEKPAMRAPLAEILGRLGDPRDLEKFVSIPGGDYPIEKGIVTIKPFEMATYPVTNKWFARFIDAGGYENAGYWSKAGRKWRSYTGATYPEYWHDREWNCPNSPVVGVCWWEAGAFCRWLTVESNNGFLFRLPTDNEWEAAAAGFEQRTYPFGKWEEGACNTDEAKIKKTSPVGIFEKGQTSENLFDMAGNVWEWTIPNYDSSKDLKNIIFDTEVQMLYDKGEPLEAFELSEKNKNMTWLLGGSWYESHLNARCFNRVMEDPNYRVDYIGFRCVRTKK